MLAHAFMERGIRIDFVLLRAEGELLADVPAGASVIDLDAKRFRNAFWPLVRYLRREQPAAVLAAMWPLTGLAALAKLVARSDCRLVVSEHSNLSHDLEMLGASDFVHRHFGGAIYKRADGVVAVSQGVKDDLVSRTGLPADAVCVIYNTVRKLSANLLPDPEILQFMESGTEVVVAVGALKEAKDYPTLLRAFARLRQTRDARLLMLGEGGLRGELEELVASLGLQDSVLMPGFVPDPYPYLARADLFVLSSAWEGLGNVIIEALVAGVPVVSTDCPSGPSEILENGKYGRLVPVGNPDALATAMAEALDKPHDRDMLRRRGNEFSVERAADQYLALLDPGGRILARR